MVNFANINKKKVTIICNIFVYTFQAQIEPATVAFG